MIEVQILTVRPTQLEHGPANAIEALGLMELKRQVPKPPGKF
jgi:hypothetical protein